MKGLQKKLEFTQGISVPSDGKSGGLAMIWKEGTNVRLKICSNLHIDMIVHSGSGFRHGERRAFTVNPTQVRDISLGNC